MASLGRHHSSVATTTLVKEAACRRRSGGGCPRKMCAFCIPASAPGPAREPLNFPPRPIPVHFTLSIEGRPHFPNSLGFISFADPHLLNPFTSYRYKNHGGGGHSQTFQPANLPTGQHALQTCNLFPIYPFSFHTVPNSFALTKNSTLFFSSNSELFAQKHPGGYASNIPTFKHSTCQRSYGPVPRLPVPKTCILRTIGAGEALRQTLPGSHLFNLEQRGRV